MDKRRILIYFILIIIIFNIIIFGIFIAFLSIFAFFILQGKGKNTHDENIYMETIMEKENKPFKLSPDWKDDTIDNPLMPSIRSHNINKEELKRKKKRIDIKEEVESYIEERKEKK